MVSREAAPHDADQRLKVWRWWIISSHEAATPIYQGRIAKAQVARIHEHAIVRESSLVACGRAVLPSGLTEEPILLHPECLQDWLLDFLLAALR